MLVHDPRRPNRLQRTLGRPLLSAAARIDSTARRPSFETAAIARWIFQPAPSMVVALIYSALPALSAAQDVSIGAPSSEAGRQTEPRRFANQATAHPNPFSSNPRTSPRQKGNTSERCVGVVAQLGSDET